MTKFGHYIYKHLKKFFRRIEGLMNCSRLSVLDLHGNRYNGDTINLDNKNKKDKLKIKKMTTLE